MADLLLSSGANVNTTYQIDKGSPWATILAELATNHVEMNVKSIKYLFNAGSSLDTNTEKVATITLTD
jgi:hypothetical protein